ncbi:hypothetical protein TVAG_286350 [Trichomonas vaginalis G3]|uniref:Uncharacterized protein n=1 Tax=Trichomonas vaginalis (strain ATCC PRA-98 / G3) TaxID=412133 RepID=A2EPE9_TRIV3|nr:hypothetical protein TVAGG3_0616220 [Trichomonas vaginalis G3]EAY05457.1 hypothetical protein TVAG_286350 [Trichomonas vaginalis G3]KAI5503565.1 hypothetical protein TVAGG3_0616220 [Trichomonas vaginalis G3]|eukprot:XP_001317680.1 hypothetical protein [Trichomonas vaginalis G3]
MPILALYLLQGWAPEECWKQYFPDVNYSDYGNVIDPEIKYNAENKESYITFKSIFYHINKDVIVSTKANDPSNILIYASIFYDVGSTYTISISYATKMICNKACFTNTVSTIKISTGKALNGELNSFFSSNRAECYLNLKLSFMFIENSNISKCSDYAITKPYRPNYSESCVLSYIFFSHCGGPASSNGYALMTYGEFYLRDSVIQYFKNEHGTSLGNLIYYEGYNELQVKGCNFIENSNFQYLIYSDFNRVSIVSSFFSNNNNIPTINIEISSFSTVTDKNSISTSYDNCKLFNNDIVNYYEINFLRHHFYPYLKRTNVDIKVIISQKLKVTYELDNGVTVNNFFWNRIDNDYDFDFIIPDNYAFENHYIDFTIQFYNGNTANKRINIWYKPIPFEFYSINIQDGTPLKIEYKLQKTDLTSNPVFIMKYFGSDIEVTNSRRLSGNLYLYECLIDIDNFQEGTYNIEYYAEDKNIEYNTSSNRLSISVASIPPEFSMVMLNQTELVFGEDEFITLQGGVSYNNINKDLTLTPIIDGKALSKQITINIKNKSTHSFTFNIPFSDLTSGPHSIKIKVRDPNSKEVFSDTLNFIIKIPLKINLSNTSKATVLLSPTTTVLLNGNGIADFNSKQYSIKTSINETLISNSIRITQGSSHSYTFSGNLQIPNYLKEGNYYIKVWITDNSISSDKIQKELFIFRNPPELTITCEQNQTFIQNVNKLINITGKVIDNDGFDNITIF